MGDYWYIRAGYEERTKIFLASIAEPSIDLRYDVIEKDFITTGKASSEIKDILKRLGVDPVLLRRVAIASYEAEINVAAHTFGGDVKVAIYEDLVQIIFEDKGPGLSDIAQAMVPGWSTADEQTREMGFGAGLGLPNIKKNVDVMHITSAAGEHTRLKIILFFDSQKK